MTLALQALLVFFVALPGGICRRAFNKGDERRAPESQKRPLAEEVVGSVLLSCVLHAAWSAWTLLPFVPAIDLRAVFTMLSGNYGDNEALLEEVLTATTSGSHPWWILAYTLSLCTTSLLLGSFARLLYDKYRLDLRFPQFRNRSMWHYTLRGELNDLKRKRPRTTSTKVLICASAVVDVADCSYLYVGIVSDYFLNKDGSLDRIVLFGTKRRKLSADKQPGAGSHLTRDADFYPVDGDLFIIDYADTKTLNIDYFYARPKGSKVARKSVSS